MPSPMPRKRPPMEALPSSPPRARPPEEEAKPAGSKGGRPSLYHEGYPDLVYEWRLVGLTAEQIAKMFKVSVDTLYEWQKVHPAFSDAWDRGGEQADAQIALALFHRAKGYSHAAEKIMVVDKTVVREEYEEHYPPDTAAAVFWLTNRQGGRWKSKQETALTGPNGGPLEPPTVNIIGVEAAPKG